MLASSRSSRFAAVLALAAVTASSLPALAQPVKEPTAQQKQEAATRFRKGLDLFKDGDYQAALIEFRRANELAPNFNVLYNIGQVYFQLQDYPGALNALQRYLSEGARTIPSARRAEVERDIEKLKQRVANIEIVVNVADADITVDDQPVGKSPLRAPILVGAGKHRVSVSKAGWTSGSKRVEIASQESQRVAFELTETASPTPAPIPAIAEPGDHPQPTPTPVAPQEKQGPSYVVPIIAWAGTGAVTTGAVITGILALGAASDLKTKRETFGVSRTSLNDAGSKASGLAALTDVLGGVAIAGVGVSIWLTVRAGSSAPADAATASATPPPRVVRLTPLPGGAAIAGTF